MKPWAFLTSLQTENLLGVHYPTSCKPWIKKTLPDSLQCKVPPCLDFREWVQIQKKSKNLRIILQSHSARALRSQQESQISKWAGGWNLSDIDSVKQTIKIWKADALTNKTSDFIYNLVSNHLIPNKRQAKFELGKEKNENCLSPNNEVKTLRHLLFESSCALSIWRLYFQGLDLIHATFDINSITIRKMGLILYHAIWLTKNIKSPIQNY